MRNDRLRLRLRHGSCRFLRHGSCRGSETWILHKSCVEDVQKWNIVRKETWIHKYADMALAQVLCSYPMRVSSLISPYIGSTSGSGAAVGEAFGEGGGIKKVYVEATATKQKPDCLGMMKHTNISHLIL